MDAPLPGAFRRRHSDVGKLLVRQLGKSDTAEALAFIRQYPFQDAAKNLLQFR
ncbi:hypothetical protein LP421_07305 [Rhizobium sp. RCAM05350]|nr:hypothetical protein LP421_07305 [Rhizobium sp. RCAM05350]